MIFAVRAPGGVAVAHAICALGAAALSPTAKIETNTSALEVVDQYPSTLVSLRVLSAAGRYNRECLPQGFFGGRVAHSQ
ncbi:hypothetical protein O4214_29690 [Rhodococcus erythropolis]|uniref:hypothetical protein n=1 Tax=Rhodococcus erythropolis TaxID=1833 RepID=UPI001E419E09|nr:MULTISPECIES: hypothetical protein [Rhodococcus erythropolis group]MCD2109244.1 hypothetical protein [Rhodococcus qingshengii]MCZ4528168.1 hypothetical protein [Rhodococcus erythropolis]